MEAFLLLQLGHSSFYVDAEAVRVFAIKRYFALLRNGILNQRLDSTGDEDLASRSHVLLNILQAREYVTLYVYLAFIDTV